MAKHWEREHSGFVAVRGFSNTLKLLKGGLIMDDEFMDGSPCPLNCENGQAKIVVKQFTDIWAHVRCSNLQCKFQRAIISRTELSSIDPKLSAAERRKLEDELLKERAVEATLVDMAMLRDVIFNSTKRRQHCGTLLSTPCSGSDQKENIKSGSLPLTVEQSPSSPVVSLNATPATSIADTSPGLDIDETLNLHKETDNSKLKQYSNKKKRPNTDSNIIEEMAESVDLNYVTSGDGSNISYYAADPKCHLHDVSNCISSTCHKKIQTEMNRVLQRSKKSFPPHLYAKVMSKKHGRMDDLSVSSFADLNMYKVGSPMKDVVRRKQPVFFGPPNRRGRRPRAKTEGQGQCRSGLLPMHISMPAEMVNGFITSARECVPQAPSISPSKFLMASSELDKYKKVPHGIGLREQLMGDFSAKPIRTRGRPRKDSAFDHANDYLEDEFGPEIAADCESPEGSDDKPESKRRSKNRHVAFQLDDQMME